MSEKLLAGLQLMVFGMVMVYVFLIIMIFCMKLMSIIIAPWQQLTAPFKPNSFARDKIPEGMRPVEIANFPPAATYAAMAVLFFSEIVPFSLTNVPSKSETIKG